MSRNPQPQSKPACVTFDPSTGHHFVDVNKMVGFSSEDKKALKNPDSLPKAEE